MTQQPLSFVGGRDLRDAGIQIAIEHAAAIHGDWPERAMGALQAYLQHAPDSEFMTENVRWFAYQDLGLPRAPHDRAWGSIMLRAARLGLIRRVGIRPVKTATSHMANASVWRAV